MGETSVISLIVNGYISAIFLAVGLSYSLYFTWTRRIYSTLLASGIFLLTLSHQIKEIRSWYLKGSIPAPDWILGNYGETLMYGLGFVLFFLACHYHDQTQKLLKEKDLLLDELKHRVKNNLQSLKSIVSIEEARAERKEDRHLIRNIQERIESFALLHEKLHETGAVDEVQVRDYLEDLCRSLEAHQEDEDRISLTTELEPKTLPVDEMIACGLVVSELVGNAFDHAFQEDTSGEITVRFSSNEQQKLIVKDNGVGVSPAAGDEMDDQKSGLKIVRNMVDLQLDGEIEFTTNGGTTATITFP